MADFNIRSDSVNVEQIMRQIRSRIREKRGVDYTEQQIRELAAVKLERFLDPTKVRSELMQQFREGGIAPLPNYGFEDSTLFDSTHAWLRFLRRLFRPVLKLIVNLNPVIHALHTQAAINERQAQYTEMSYEILHNLVVEVTRLGIEAKNLKMRVESLSSRLDFSERRARALEGVVQYKAGEIAEEAPAGEAGARETRGEGSQAPAPAGEPRRRRRRRRGRRGGAGGAAAGEDAGQNGAADENEGEPEGAQDAGGPAEAPQAAEGPSDRGEAPRPSREAADNGHEDQ
jgi:hypothetical protein